MEYADGMTIVETPGGEGLTGMAALRRKRTWTVTGGGAPEGVSEVVVGVLTQRHLDVAQRDAWSESREVYGDDWRAWKDGVAESMAIQRKDGEAADTAPTLRSLGSTASIVRQGVVSVDGEALPTDDAERRAFVEGLPAAALEWLGTAVGRANGKLDADRPTASG